MEKYNLTQTGPEVQEILDSATPQSELTAETQRAQQAEHELQLSITDEENRAKSAERQNADDIDAIENKIPSSASSENKLATIGDVNDEADTRAGADAALRELIDEISALIPEAASALNQLADKQFVSEEIIEQIVAAIPNFAGQFTTLAQLQDVESPKAGDIGIVRTKDTDGHDVFTFYQYKDGQWNEFYSLSYHPQRKPASTGLVGDAPYNGMGRIELPMNWVEGWPNDTWLYYPYNDVVYLMYYWNGLLYAPYNSGTQEGLGLDDNLVVKPLDYNIADIEQFVGQRYLPFTESSGVWTITKPDDSTITSTELNNTNIYKINDPTHHGINVLTQAMINRPNTIYVIQHDYDLNGETITVPENCTLEFDGGSLNNGVVTLNGAKISANGKIFGDNVSFTEESGLVFKATWFGLNPSVDCSDLLENILSYLADRGTLMVDTDIRLDKPISVSNLYYTNIIGEINPVCIGHHKYSISSDYTPQHTNDQLISIEGEGVAISNVSLVWQSSWEGIEDDVREERSKTSCLLRSFPKTEYHAEGDITVSDCVMLTTTYNCIHATGRGLYVLNCILTCGTYSANTEPLACIIIKGKANGDTAHYQRPEDAVRGIVIDGNRIHGGKGLYFVRFDQDDTESLGYNPEDTTFYGVSITNNLLDVGTSGIYSTSKIRGLNVANNVFNLFTPRLYFCYFLNDLSDFDFVNNIISEPYTVEEPAHIAQFNKGLFAIKFGDEGSVLPEFKNINISNNNIDCTGGNSVVYIESSLVNGEVERYIEGFLFKNNIFSSRYATGYGEGMDSTIALVNMKNISANKIVIADNLMCREFEDKDCFALYYTTDSASHDSFLKDVYIGENPGTVSRIKTYSDFYYPNLERTNVREPYGVRQSGSKEERPTGRNNIYPGFQYMQIDDINGTFPIWASAISGDTVTWVDAIGTPV